MAASYPSNIRAFQPHKDNAGETVAAAHINAPQEEMFAVQSVLGTSPQIDPTLNTRINDYGTIRARLEDAQRGSSIPAVNVLRSNYTNIVNSTSTNMSFESEVYDTFTMYDPLVPDQITIKRNGFYLFTAAQLFFSSNSTFNSAGYRETTIRVDGTIVAGDSKPAIDSGGRGTRCSVTWAGFCIKNQAVRLVGFQFSNATIQVQGFMSGFLIRGE